MQGFDVFYIDHAQISSTTTTHTGTMSIVCLADIPIRGIGSITNVTLLVTTTKATNSPV